MCVKSGASYYGKVSGGGGCAVVRLMAVMGVAGVLRGKKVHTTVSRKVVAGGDRLNHQFVAERPDQQ